MAVATKKNSVDRFVESIRKDKLTRIRLISRITDFLVDECGVKREDIKLLPPIDKLPEHTVKLMTKKKALGLVIWTRTDGDTNTESIIICGK